MTALGKLYQEIDQRGQAALATGQEELDPNLLPGAHDTRLGLTLLGRLPAHVCRNIEFYLQALAQLAPDQYYYPAADMHVTVMDLLAAWPDQQISPATFARYQRVVADLVATAPAPHWHFQGLMVSPGAIMVKGFYSPALTTLRQRLRQAVPAAGLDLAERYPTISGHVTVVRFRQRLAHPTALARKLADAQAVDFGSFTMPSLDLVVHDWYNHQVPMTVTLPFAR